MLTGFSGMRALAALAVVLYHINQQLPLANLPTWGWDLHQFVAHFSVMVSVFFILSGFFRSWSYWKNMDTRENLPKFWISLRDRWWRIAPAYYLTLVLALVATSFFYGKDQVDLVAFFVGFTFLSWISPETLFPVLLDGPLWFISFDMIGWVFTSLFMMGLSRVDRKYWILYALGIVGVTYGLHHAWMSLPWTPGQGISSVWFPIYNPFLFFLHFLFGIAAAGVVYEIQKRDILPTRKYDLGVFIIFAFASSSIWDVRGQSELGGALFGPYHFPWLTALIAIICIFLPFTRYIGKVLDTSFFRFTAEISYSLFLIHGIIMVGLRSLVFTDPFTLTTWLIYGVVTFCLSYLSAWLMYRYIELPCIPKKRH